MKIADRLKQLRESAKLSKKQLIQQVPVNYSTYANWEAGTREPNSDALLVLADYYKVSIDYIIGRTDIKECHSTKNDFLLRPEETDHILKYRPLPIESKRRVDNVLDYEYNIYETAQGQQSGNTTYEETPEGEKRAMGK